MAEQERTQLINAATQTTAVGNFLFDRIDDKDIAISKLAFGAIGTVVYVDASNPLPVVAAATDALLTTIDADTGNIATSAASIDTKTPALGQAAASASVPVVLPADQITTLTPPAAITGFALAANQLPDGHNVTIDNASVAVTGPLTDTELRATAVPVSGTVDLGATDNAVLDAIAASVASVDGKVTAANTGAVTISTALPAGTNNIGDVDVLSLPALAAGSNTIGAVNLAQYTPASGRLPVDGSGVTQPVSGTVAVTGTQTDALTDTQLRATAVPISGTVTAELSATDNAVLDAIAASVAGTLTVTGAGGSFPVTDSGGSLTVDAPVGTPVFVRLSDGSSAITTLPVSLASVPSHAVTVASGGIASGAIASGAVASGAFASGSIAAGAVVAGATSFVKLEDVASANADAGVPAMAIRRATPVNSSGTDGDYEMLQMSAGRLWVSSTVDAALPAGTNNIGDVDVLSLPALPTGTNSIGQVTANAGTNLNTSALALETGGNLAAAATSLGNIEDAVYVENAAPSKFVGLMAYDEADTGEMKSLKYDNASGGLQVTIVNSLNPLSVTTNHTHDAVASATGWVLVGGYASAAAPADVSADGDATRFWALRNGSLVTNLAVGGTLVTASAGLPVAGGVAHDGVDSGAPNKQGARAKGSLSAITLVAADDRTDLFAGLDGVQIARPHSPLEDLVSGVAAITDGSSTSVIGAQGANIKTYITSVTIANTSATPVTVDLRDGTAGSVKWTLPVPAGGGVVHTFPSPLGFSANTIVAADPSASASTITISLSGFRSKV